MKAFLQRFSEKVLGVVNGFDRFVIRGFLRPLQVIAGMRLFLQRQGVLLKEFGTYALETTEKVKAASLRAAQETGRPRPFVSSPKTDKAKLAQAIAQKQGVTEGLIAVLGSTEVSPCYRIFRNRLEKRIELDMKPRPCLHYYHYLIDPVFGFMNARIQTWFPFNIQICLNGREWLARAMDREGLRYEKRENCFVWIDDIPRAQVLMDQFLRTSWPETLDRFRQMLNPVHEEILGAFRAEYYWMGYETEWASDLLFRTREDVADLHPVLVRHALLTFQSPHIMRFLGQKLNGNFQGEVTTRLAHRPEGVVVRHAVKTNSIKFYDKQGSVLRVETTVNNPRDFKVYRPKEGDPEGPRSWRKMRQGLADLHRRAEVCQGANNRYLDALAAADTSTLIGQLVEPITRPTRWHRQRVRGLRPWSEEDRALLVAVLRGEFTIHGFRNRDLQAILFRKDTATPEEQRRRTGKITRSIRMLRAHGLIHKVPSEHRYVLSQKGRQILVALSATQNLTLQELQEAAA